jgi:hypothetical protein
MSASEFISKLFGDLPALFKDESELRAIWSNPKMQKFPETRKKLFMLPREWILTFVGGAV